MYSRLGPTAEIFHSLSFHPSLEILVVAEKQALILICDYLKPNGVYIKETRTKFQEIVT